MTSCGVTCRRATPTGVMRAGDWKLLEFFEDGRLELYNLGSDPGEERDRKRTAGMVHFLSFAGILR